MELDDDGPSDRQDEKPPAGRKISEEQRRVDQKRERVAAGSLGRCQPRDQIADGQRGPIGRKDLEAAVEQEPGGGAAIEEVQRLADDETRDDEEQQHPDIAEAERSELVGEKARGMADQDKKGEEKAERAEEPVGVCADA